MTAGARELPELRPELALLPSAPHASGAPAWLIHDPVQNRFVQIDEATYHTLSLWPRCRTVDELIAMARAGGRVELDSDTIAGLVEFLHRSKLTLEAPKGGWRYFADERARLERSPTAWLLHNYLFFRLPLVRPQAFLERTLPLAAKFAAPTAIVIYWLLGIAGLYLASREWDRYLGTFADYLTWDGAVVLGVALALVKAAHELGHAYVAVRFGCRVPTMGIALILMAPLPYTDVTDAWRLRDRRQRLLIDSAGLRVELAVAAMALFAWAILPEGPLKGAAFVLSAVSLATTLVINLNPFMKFDGYYLLSEWLGVENLQQRAFELGRWKLREILLGLRRLPPETLPRRRLTLLISFAWATWVYRLVSFIGIALVVYHYFFKVLGIVLFAVEIVYFIAIPVAQELKAWWGFGHEIRRARRAYVTGVAAALLLIAAAVPIATRVEIPAVIEAAEIRPVHPPRAARVVAVHVAHGAAVEVGTPLVSLTSPDIDNEIDLNRTKLRLARLQHGRRGASPDDRGASLVLESSIAALTERIGGLEKERAELVLRAPIAGRISELDPELHAGRWIGRRQPLLNVAGTDAIVARGYVTEADRWRIAAGNAGRFVPDHAQRGILDVTVADIAIGAASAIEIPGLWAHLDNAGREKTRCPGARTLPSPHDREFATRGRRFCGARRRAGRG